MEFCLDESSPFVSVRESSASTFVSPVELLLDDFVEESRQLVGGRRAGHQRLGIVAVQVDLFSRIVFGNGRPTLVNGKTASVAFQILKNNL
jgi:hypothetical protein